RYGTMKDAQQILRHASIRTTANVYMQQIPASVVAAINARTRAILAAGRELSSETQSTTGSNLKRGFLQVLKRLAPQVGLEPTTLRLTAGCSAIELLRSVVMQAREARLNFPLHNIIPTGRTEACG